MIRNALYTSLFLATVTISPAAQAADEVFIQKPEVVPVEVRGAKKAAPKKKTTSRTLDIKSGPKAQWIWGRKSAGANEEEERAGRGRSEAAIPRGGDSPSRLTPKRGGLHPKIFMREQQANKCIQSRDLVGSQSALCFPFCRHGPV